MSRISIDVTPEEHRQLKALAALQGKSIKEFVLARTIGAASDALALEELERLLDARIRETRSSGPSDRTVASVFQQARDEASRRE